MLKPLLWLVLAPVLSVVVFNVLADRFDLHHRCDPPLWNFAPPPPRVCPAGPFAVALLLAGGLRLGSLFWVRSKDVWTQRSALVATAIGALQIAQPFSELLGAWESDVVRIPSNMSLETRMMIGYWEIGLLGLAVALGLKLILRRP